MWITLTDKNQELVINFDKIIAFSKTYDCKHLPCIELAITQGGINLAYETNEERDKNYEFIKDTVGGFRKVGQP